KNLTSGRVGPGLARASGPGRVVAPARSAVTRSAGLAGPWPPWALAAPRGAPTLAAPGGTAGPGAGRHRGSGRRGRPRGAGGRDLLHGLPRGVHVFATRGHAPG